MEETARLPRTTMLAIRRAYREQRQRVGCQP